MPFTVLVAVALAALAAVLLAIGLVASWKPPEEGPRP